MSFDILNKEKYITVMDSDQFQQISQVPLAVIKDWLDNLVGKYQRKIDILEYGSGVSTIWYAKAFPEARIISIEGNEEWYIKVNGWLKREKLTNVEYFFVKQTGDWRNPSELVNPEYLNIPQGSYDLIINDGGLRELVAETLMLDMDNYLKSDGLYLRHDYEKLVKGEWVGKGLDGTFNRKTYESFVLEHSNYSVITIGGNGKWGVLCELGGLWRRL